MSDLCVLVEYRFRREVIPGSRRWHLIPVTDWVPGPAAPGEVEVADAGDHVSLYYRVPCDAQGKVDQETQDEYVEIAEGRFLQIRPGADLA